MNKKKGKKAVKRQKGLSRKPACKRHQPVANKKVDHSVKASTACSKAKKPIQQSAARQPKSAVHPRHGTGKSSPAAAPKSVSPQLQQLERGRQWKQLHKQGYSFARLADKFGCSKSLVSNLLHLASLPEELETLYLQRKLGLKKVLQMDWAGKKHVKARAVVINEDLKKTQQQKLSPEAKILVASNPQKYLPPKAQAVVPSGDLQKNPIRIPAPGVTKEGRQKRVSEHAKLITDWFHSLDLAPCFWQGFLSQVNSALYGGLPWLFAGEGPRPNEIRPGADSWEVIERCKVERKNPQFVTDIINDTVTWLARWVQRVIPDRRMMVDAIDQARGQLLREARKTRGF